MDFVVELPKSTGFDTVITVVDSVSKTAYFILAHTTVSIEEVARLSLYYM